MQITRTIPTDTAKAKNTTARTEDWKRADGAHELFKELVQAKPRAKARNRILLGARLGTRTTRRVATARARRHPSNP